MQPLGDEWLKFEMPLEIDGVVATLMRKDEILRPRHLSWRPCGHSVGQAFDQFPKNAGFSIQARSSHPELAGLPPTPWHLDEDQVDFTDLETDHNIMRQIPIGQIPYG